MVVLLGDVRKSGETEIVRFKTQRSQDSFL